MLLALSGHITARPRAVFDALDARFRPGGSSKTLYLADPSAFLIITQGGWWYRGEYRIVPDESGSNVEHTLLNIAHQRRMGSLTGRRVITSAPADFERMLKQLRLELE